MPRNRGRQASGREVAAPGVVADEAGELPPELRDLAAPSPELASVGAGLLEAAELGDACTDLLEQPLGQALLAK
jgi:hypothetical protein